MAGARNAESSGGDASDTLVFPGLNVQDPSRNDVPPKQQRHIHSSLSSGKKYLLGLVLVCLIACSWVGSTQTAKSAYTGDFKAPFFSMWFGTAWMVSIFPLAVPVYLFRENKSLYKLWRLVVTTLYFRPRLYEKRVIQVAEMANVSITSGHGLGRTVIDLWMTFSNNEVCSHVTIITAVAF